MCAVQSSLKIYLLYIVVRFSHAWCLITTTFKKNTTEVADIAEYFNN